MNTFCNDYVRIDASGIELLRNQFAYQHIDYAEIRSIKIHNGHLLRNRLIPMLAGLFLVAISLKLMIPVADILNEIGDDPPNTYHGRGLAMMLSMPVLLLGIGAYFFVQSLRSSKILSIRTEKKRCNIRIKEFEKSNELGDFIGFLKEKMPGMVEIE